jgi:hypothetical protein
VIRATFGAMALACAVSAGCARQPPPAPVAAQSASSEPRWQDVFDATPELLLVVFPRQLRRDKFYGGLLRRAMEMARESSNAVAETRTLDAMEAAEEIIIGVRPRAAAFAGETIVVVRGAPSDVDPARLVDAEGHALWTPGPLGATDRLRELVRAAPPSAANVPADGGAADDGALDASLFELPGATWVIASGAARARAHAVLNRPVASPGPPVIEGVLAAARLDGASLVRRLPPLREGGLLAAIGARLRSATVALPPGAERAIRVTLAYADEGAARGAETRARLVVATVAQSKPDPATWLAGLSTATVTRAGADVTLEAPLPERLIDALLNLNQPLNRL